MSNCSTQKYFIYKEKLLPRYIDSKTHLDYIDDFKMWGKGGFQNQSNEVFC